MNCTFDKERLTAFYDGELDAAGKSEVERHISSCSECLRDLGEIKSASLLVKELPRPRAPRSIAEGVSREIAATGRAHSFSRARPLVLWATAAAAGLFIVANVMFFAGGPAPAPESANARRVEAPLAPAMGALPTEAGEKKDGRKSEGALALKEEKPAGYRSEPAPGKDAKEADRALAPEDGAAKKAPEPAKAVEELAKSKAPAPAEEKAAEAPKPVAAAKPAAPSAPPAATPPPAPEAKQRLDDLARNQFGQGNRNEAPVLVNVSGPEIAKVRSRVEEIARRYADRANFAGRQLQNTEGMKKLDTAAQRESSAGPITLDLTPAEYEALKAEIEKATGAQLAFAGPADARLRGSLPAAGKAGAPEAERAATGGGGLAKAAPGAAPHSEEQRRKAADEKLAAANDPKQQAPAGQQAPSNNQKDNVQPRDKNAQEAEPRHLAQGETRIRIVLNFLEVPVAEKK
jgi:hypothetical protein